VEVPESHLARRPAGLRPKIPILLVTGFLGLLLSWGIWAGIEESNDRADAENLSVNLFRGDPVESPLAVHPAAAGMSDDAPVIGVTAGSRARAYALTAFANVRDHVLNDFLGGVALTVTHCPRTGCTKVFTDATRGRPLAIAVGGWAGKPGLMPGQDSVLLLRVDDVRYYQDSGEAMEGSGAIPYTQADFDQTTWGEWRRAHPETDVVPGRDLQH
jgi:hypothetical protein